MPKVTFTGIPVGYEQLEGARRKYSVAILVTPKLEAGTVPAAFVNWPEFSRNLLFDINVGVHQQGKVTGTPFGVAAKQKVQKPNQELPALYDRLMKGARSRGFQNAAINVDTTLKTYDAAAVDHCIHEFSRRLLVAQLRSGSPETGSTSSYTDELESLVREHYPFEITKVATVASPIAKNPQPKPAPTSVASNAIEGFSMALQSSQGSPVGDDQLLGLSPGLVPIAKLETYIRNIASDGDYSLGNFVAILTKIDVDRRNANVPYVSAMTPAEEQAALARTVFWRDTERIGQISPQNQLNPAASADLLQVMIRQFTGAIEQKIQNPLLDLNAFWQRSKRRPTKIGSQSAVWAKYESQSELEFHERWALIGHYPELFSAMGVVLHLDWIPSSSEQSVIEKNFCISVTLADPSVLPGFEIEAPWVNYSPTNFQVASVDGSVQDGYLRLDPDLFFLQTCDVDGGGQKLQEYVTTLAGKLKLDPDAICRLAETEPRQLLPPSYRTSGLSLIHKQRQDEMTRRLRRMQVFDPKTDVVSAEDLVRGYVIDLWAAPEQNSHGEWFSLCDAEERVYLDGAPLLVQRREVSVKPAYVESHEKPEGQPAIPELYILQSIVDWRGGSLAVAPKRTPQPAEGEMITVPRWGLHSIRTLPRDTAQCPLSVGALYRVAVRVELLTGHLVARQPSPPSMLPEASESPLELWRYEPLSPPAVLVPGSACDPADETDSKAHTIVLRSDSGIHSTWRTEHRILIPPRVEERVARMHYGRDQAEGLAFGFRRLRRRTNDGSLLPVDRTVFDPEPNLPYLPDPFSREIVALVSDDIDKKVHGPLRLRLTGPGRHNWPDYMVHLLTIRGTNEHAPTSLNERNAVFSFLPGFSFDSRRLEVTLPAGHTATLTIQSGFGEDGRNNLKRMALWRQCLKDSKLCGPNNANLSWEDAQIGGILELSGSLQLQLVHAVRKPSKELTIDFQPRSAIFSSEAAPHTTRSLSETVLARQKDSSLVLSYRPLHLDRKSTGKMRVVASWNEWRDHDGSIEIARGSSLATDELVARNSDVPLGIDPDTMTSTFTFNPGNTKFCRMQIHSTAVSRFREYFPEYTNELDCSTESAQQDIELLSSARPDPPVPIYVVPTFEWVNSEHRPNGFSNRRISGGLRIYLQGLWMSSGEDELLAVVLFQGRDVPVALARTETRSLVPFHNPPKGSLDEKYVSTWGGDPLFAAQQEMLPLFVEGWEGAFHSSNQNSGRSQSEEGDGACGWNLSIQEAESVRVAVVGFKPSFDQRRHLWFCDISFTQAPLYGTFINLALARYQPHSVPGAELSLIVNSGFSRMNPDRTLIVQPKRLRVNDKMVDGIAITIWGIRSGGGVVGENEFEVVLEHRGYQDSSELGWEIVTVVKKVWPPPTPPTNAAGPPQNASEAVLWYGECVPNPCSGRRLVIREYELFEQDGGIAPNIARRLVYADVVQIA